MSLFSIITVSLNTENGIKRTANSILKQKERDFDWIVIDGGSTDGTAEFVKNIGISNYFVSEKDNGIYHAMNKGILASQGEYCLFLNAGDELYNPYTLLEVKENLGADILVGRMQVISHDNQEKNRIQDFSKQDIRKKYLYSRTLPHPATFIKRSIFSIHGLYDEKFLIAGDHDFFVRILMKGASMSFIQTCVSIFYMDGISTKMKSSKTLKREIDLIRRKNFLFYYRIWRKLIDRLI